MSKIIIEPWIKLKGSLNNEDYALISALQQQCSTNADASELARQNAIYFGDRMEQEHKDAPNERVIMPEDEERRGMFIYLAEKDEQTIGKVHLQMLDGAGAIYGLGVLPQNRGQGFGRAILLNAIQKLQDAKAKEIMLQVASENTAALNLYRSCGFQERSTMDYYELE